MQIKPEILKSTSYGWNAESTVLFTTGGQEGELGVEVPGIHLRLYIDRNRLEPMLVLVAKTMRWQLFNVRTGSGSVITHYGMTDGTGDYFQTIPMGSAKRATESFITKKWEVAKEHFPDLVKRAYAHYRENGTSVPLIYFDDDGNPCFF
jgi:hypothetical protein